MLRYLFIFLTLCYVSVSAQKISPSVVANGGAVMKAGNLSLEWTLGEMITETKTAASLVVTQGFHQSNLASVAVINTSLEGLSVYPNPASSVLIIDNPIHENLTYQLTNIEGKVIRQNNLSVGSQQLQLDELCNGLYILTILNKQKEQKIFTIEKIK
ncbi:MAG: T9SS type A sorting domain-containing protein [Saprospiraceae bacterium]|nr:T9SS type A sorting domain-containing protein [Saprospiraceae bacterium]